MDRDQGNRIIALLGIIAMILVIMAVDQVMLN